MVDYTSGDRTNQALHLCKNFLIQIVEFGLLDIATRDFPTKELNRVQYVCNVKNYANFRKWWYEFDATFKNFWEKYTTTIVESFERKYCEGLTIALLTQPYHMKYKPYKYYTEIINRVYLRGYWT